jgi:hypothetical protein
MVAGNEDFNILLLLTKYEEWCVDRAEHGGR